jgi:uncharacterized protein YejL (UPF0352 family)
MSRCVWIVCEQTSGWATALRLAASRAIVESAPRLVETRTLAELSSRLEEHRAAIALIEVRAGNLATTLQWLATASRRHVDARYVALLNYSLAPEEATFPGSRSSNRRRVVEALLEAGAVDVSNSPRRLRHVFAIAEKHWAATWPCISSATQQPLLEMARDLLPWQKT